MTRSSSGESDTRDIVVREPRPDEFARVAYLFRNVRLRAGSRFIAAERMHPLPRFIGAATWWADGALGRFRLACPPGSAQTEAAGALIEGVLAAARDSGLDSVQYADLLPDGDVCLEVLQARGFERLRSERSFEVAARDAWTRITRLYTRHQAVMPPRWRTEPIRDHRPEEVLDLIAPHRLLPPEELRAWWQATAAAGFDLEMSCILFDQERPFGVLLARRAADVLHIDVQVVNESNPRRRSLADLLLVYHLVRRVRAEGPIRLVKFRSGQTEHRQTANLALRMGGRELLRLHVFGKRLT